MSETSIQQEASIQQEDRASAAAPTPVSRKGFFAAVGAATLAGAAAAAMQPAADAHAAMTSDLPWFNIRDYGAVGDGVADDAPAIEKALAALGKARDGARVGVLYIPQGDYRVGHRISVSDSAWRLVIRGDGMGVSRLIGANADGVLKIAGTSRANTFTVEQLSFFAALPGAGTALEITMPEGGNLHNRTLVVSHIEMRGLVPNADYFTAGLRAIGHWRPLIYDAVFAGVFGPGTDSTNPDSAHYKPEVGFQVDGSYAPAFHYCYSWSAHTGYSVKSTTYPGPEDSSFYRSFAVECRVGIDIETANRVGEPQLEIDTLHVNCMDVGIRIKNRKYFQITNCLLYGYVYGTNPPQPYTDIELIGSYGGIIAHTIFHQPTNPTRTMITIDDTSYDIAIRDNLFNAAQTAIRVAPGAKNIRVIHNDFNTRVKGANPLVHTVLDDQSGKVIFRSDELRQAIVGRTDALAVPSGSWLVVPWQTRPVDTAGFGSANPTELVIPAQVGIRQVRVSAQVEWSGGGSRPGWQDVEVLLNGEPAIGVPAHSRPIPVIGNAIARPMQLASAAFSVSGGDRISMRVRHDGAATASIEAARSWLSVESVEG